MVTVGSVRVPSYHNTSKYNVNKDISHRMRFLGHVLVFSVCCNTGAGTAGKAVPGGALNSYFEASGSASGYGIERSSWLYIIQPISTLLCIPCTMGIYKTLCLEYQ